MDEELNKRYGKLQKQYDKFNKLDYIKDVVVIYKDNIAAGCGAFKKYNDRTIEIKRIFVKEAYRGQGLSKLLLAKLEQFGIEKGFKYAVLETGVKQNEAIGLYESSGYTVIDNFGQYEGNSNSICFKKAL
ncbi:GNAT family N-acetyltransferase [Clostridium oryzae]|uniref:Putative N-acetyltransferase YsnE n=1 Tax=Clostridium oryzae TaxID=1450648 RepID=A0A1V4ISU8_9CLOT|nr:GNAT family N-acetyltransferase [Clostridium oryzae]OPJ62875.1 putative N-acetyltransferase YsnE [Clostridium oryzae]